jgi:hypothetical protein
LEGGQYRQTPELTSPKILDLEGLLFLKIHYMETNGLKLPKKSKQELEI